jgi:hypothetical protein
MARKERQSYNWTFYGFETAGKNRPVSDWINALSPDAKDELVDMLLYMRIRPPNEWGAEHFKPLEEGLSEIRFKDSDAVCRIYGHFGPVSCFQSYTMLVGAEKKVSNDRDSKKLAKTRRGQLERNEARIYKFDFEE